MNFGCVADAIGYYFEQGFRTVWDDGEVYERVMSNGRDYVTIRNNGLLSVEVIEDLNVWGDA